MISKLSDHELSPSEELETGELARFALEVTGLGCWEVDVVTGTVRRSRRYDQIFGHDAPLPFWDHERFLEQVHTEDRVAVDTLYREALTAGTDWQFVCRIHRANDGAFRRVEIRGRHLAASDGLPGRLLGTVRDITEVEQATRTAREIAAQLRFITDAAPLLISYVDAGLRYRFVNEGYTKWFARPADQIIGRTVPETIGQAAFEKARPQVERALGGERITYEALLPYGDGQNPRFIHSDMVPDVAEDGTVRGYVAVVLDITDRKRAEAENAELTAALQEVAVRQRRFLREMLYGLTEGKFRLCDTAADLPVPLSPAGAPVILSAPTLRILRERVRAAAEGMQFAAERVQDLLTAAGEASKNAVRHAGAGKAQVHLDPEAGVIQVWVTDDGAGIAPENIHRVVERGWTTGGFGAGFFLMRSTADRIYLLTGGSGTTIVLEQDRIPPVPTWLNRPPSQQF